MSAAIDLLNKKIVPVISLVTIDNAWASVLAGSMAGRLFGFLQGLFSRLGKAGAGAGGFFQVAGFWLCVLLFLILPAPQFASDKEAIALIVAAAFAFRIAGTVLGGKETYKPCAIDAIVLAYLAINLIATFSSHYLAESIKGFAKMVVYVSSYFVFSACIAAAPRKRSLLLLGALLFSGLLVSLYGLYQYKIGVAPLATWEDPSVDEKTTRIYSTLRNPNLLAGYLVPMVPVACGLSLAGFALNGWRKISGVLSLGTAAIIMVAVFLTGSRGGYIGIGAGLADLFMIIFFWLWAVYPRLRPALLAAVVLAPVALAGVLHMFPTYEHRVLSIFAGREHSSNSYRLNVYASSFKMFLDNWWIGVGPGNQTFRLCYGLYMRSGFDALGTYCVPLEVAVECGIGGVAIFLGLVVSLIARAHHWFWVDRSFGDRWITAGAAAGIVALMLHGLVDTVFYRPQVQLIFWLLAAVVVSLAPKARPVAGPESSGCGDASDQPL